MFVYSPGTPILALTGSADTKSQKTIISKLALNNPTKLFISPNRRNLRISMIKCKKSQIFDNLLWLIESVKKNGTLNDIATLFNFLLLKLGKEAYIPNDCKNSENCLIGIYHSLTLAKYKERLVKSLKTDGKKRIAIASTALSMGINFPDVRYIVHWGPARNMLDYHQESGRAGRDNMPANVIVIYHGQQLSFSEDDVKVFVKAAGCYRIAAYQPFDSKIESVIPLHDWCKNCAKEYNCVRSQQCIVASPIFELDPVVEQITPAPDNESTSI